MPWHTVSTDAARHQGVAHAESVGFDEIVARGAATAEALPREIVYAGFSLGTLPAQFLTQTRPGARGSLLLHGGISTAQFASTWPAGVPVQLHTMDGDEWVEIDELEALAREVPEAELFRYPGTAHLFADSRLRDYDEHAASLLMHRTLAFLESLSR